MNRCHCRISRKSLLSGRAVKFFPINVKISLSKFDFQIIGFPAVRRTLVSIEVLRIPWMQIVPHRSV